MKKIFTIIAFVFALSIAACNGLNGGNSKTHLVTFDSNGGSAVPSQNVKHGEKAERPANPTKDGYSFSKWTYNGEEWSFIGYVVTNDMVLSANWNANLYTLTLNNPDESLGIIYGEGVYPFDSNVTISAVPIVGYSFTGWFDSNNNLFSNQATYSFNMGFDLSLTARWAVKKASCP